MSKKKRMVEKCLRDYQVFGPLQPCIPGEITDVGIFEYIRTHSVQEGTTGSWTASSHAWLDAKIQRRRPDYIIVDDMEGDFINTTASEVPKELEYHEHRD